MRCTQFMGLHSTAEDFLKEHCRIVVIDKCPHCGGPLQEGRECEVYESAAHVGMFDDGPELHEYQLRDGRKAREVVQDAPWSSGPCIFLCLEVDGKRVGEWPQKDIDEA
jgi:hypothetical protein